MLAKAQLVTFHTIPYWLTLTCAALIKKFRACVCVRMIIIYKYMYNYHRFPVTAIYMYM